MDDPNVFQGKLEALDRLLHAEIDLRDRATRLQQDEYARRLDELNHAHARAEADKLKYVSVDLYTSEYRSLRDAAKLDREIVITMQADLATMRTLVYGAVGVILLGVAGSILALVIKR